MSAFFPIAKETLSVLCRRRLFWLLVWLSAAVVAGFASLDCAESGFSLFFGLKTYNSDFLRAGTPWEVTLYHGVLQWILTWWVAGALPLLSVFAVAGIMPASLERGAAALLFPVARSRSAVLLGRFAGGLGYALVLSFVCVSGLFLVLGWRLGEWQPRLFLAVPYTVLIFSFLNAVVMVLGVVARSATAAVLVTLLFAGSVWALQDVAGRVRADRYESREAALDDEEEGPRAVEWIAAGLPRTHEVLAMLKRDTGVPSPRPFRELVRRWRVGKVKIGAAAVDALDAGLPRAAEPAAVPGIEVLVVTLLFEFAVLAGGVLYLRRRDL